MTDLEELERIVAYLNGPDVQEATRPWQEQVKIACEPHPHEGPHRLECTCGKIIEVRNRERKVVG